MGARKWIKSSYSTSPNGNCVECCDDADMIAVRDSKDPEGGMLRFNRKDFGAFVSAIR